MYSFYPVYLDLTSKKCFVVGGGKVAERKVKSLLECGADVWLVSLTLTEELNKLAEENQIHFLNRKFSPDDLDGCFLVISATDDSYINRKVADECLKRNILVNVVDEPDKCSFIVPSVMRRGDLCIAISTSGKSPLLSKKLRLKLEKLFEPEYAEYLELMGKIREKVLQEVSDQKSRREIFECLVNSDILESIQKGEKELVKQKVAKCLSLSIDEVSLIL